MQINFLSKFVDQLTEKKQNLLLKTGLILIIVVCSTFEIAVSRIAEEETEQTSESETSQTIDTTESSQRASIPDPEESETPVENQQYTEFGLSTRNPFDSDSTSKHFIWQDDTEQPVEIPDQMESEEDPLIQPYLESLSRWRYPPHLTDLSKLYNWKPKPKRDEKGIALPMDSNLRITGLQSVTIEANKTHYFGEGDLNRYGGYGYGGGYGSYSSGLDLGLTSSYGYEDFGYSSGGFGGGYGSGYGGGYSSYGSGYGSG